MTARDYVSRDCRGCNYTVNPEILPKSFARGAVNDVVDRELLHSRSRSLRSTKEITISSSSSPLCHVPFCTPRKARGINDTLKAELATQRCVIFIHYMVR